MCNKINWYHRHLNTSDIVMIFPEQPDSRDIRGCKDDLTKVGLNMVNYKISPYVYRIYYKSEIAIEKYIDNILLNS